MDTLKTGDLLLFNNESSGWFGNFTSMIKWGTHSNYSHVGMILKNPSFIHPSLKGLYLWESSYNGTEDPQDGKIKLGVQITPLDTIIKEYKKSGGKIFIRKLKYMNDNNDSSCDNLIYKNIFNDEKLKEIHSIVYNKPYDIVPTDWLSAFFNYDISPQKTSRFWCSALVGYIYTKLDILVEKTDWSILKPNNFSLDGEDLNYTGLCKLENLEIRLL
tara:strand:- start:55 stop:702 length:648 start_codon:yes stop_codon:yes gene_type:complete